MTTVAAIIPIAGAAPPSEASAVSLMIIGMLVVFVSLSVIGLLIALSNRVFADRKPGPGGAETPETAQRELIAVLTAAATAALRRPVRVHRVRMLGLTGREPWVTEGRVGIMTSHRIRKRPEP